MLKNKIYRIFKYKLSLKLHRFFNHNKNFTIISRDCVGGLIYHQYGTKFLSPTINLYIKLNEFNYFCLYLEEYIRGKMIEISEEEKNFPIGLLIPKSNKLPKIRIYFMHYNSFEEAIKKWNERKERINWNNIYIVNNCTTKDSMKLLNKQIVDDFNKIKYKKMIFVKERHGFNNEFIIKDDKGIIEKRNENSWKYVFNDFNLNHFLNKKERMQETHLKEN